MRSPSGRLRARGPPLINRALPILVFGTVTSVASAKPQHGGGSALIAARGLAFADHAGDAPDMLATAGLDLRGAVALGGFPVGFAGGMGYHLGASVPGGFAYEARLLPVGFAVFLDGIAWIAVTGGGDLSGVTTRVPFAPRWIAETRIELQLPGPVHFTTFFRPAWLAVDARENGTESHFADELDAGAGFRFGAERQQHGIDVSRGLFIGGVTRQWLGVTGYGLLVGYTVDGQFGG